MFNQKRILGVIPARGGSKGIPRKNIRMLAGKPLIQYAIDAGIQSKYIDYVLVSTDDPEIADISIKAGASVPFMRPAELAADTSTTAEAVAHAVEALRNHGETFDTLVLLQPTQPLRTSDDIDAAIEKYMSSGCRPLASVSPVGDHPLLIRTISNDILEPLLHQSSTCRRQDMPPYYRINGCIYINEVNTISRETSFNDNRLSFVMDAAHSVDIDDMKDFAVAEYYLGKHTRD